MHYKDFGKIEDEMMLKGGKLRDLKSISDYAKQYQEASKNHKGKTKLSSATYELHILLGLGNDFFYLIVDRLKAKDPKFLEIIKQFLKRHSLLRLICHFYFLYS